MSNEFFVFPAGLPEVITGAGEVARLSSTQAANLSAGIADAESAGKGLAATLAMLAFGSVSYKTNPWAEFKTARGRALSAAFGGFPRVTVKPGKGIALSDFQAFFDAAVKGVMNARNAQHNPYLVPKSERKPKAPKTPSSGVTVTGAPSAGADVVHVRFAGVDSVFGMPLGLHGTILRETNVLMQHDMDNQAVLDFERLEAERAEAERLAAARASAREAERLEAERIEAERIRALEAMKQEAIARLARRDEDIRLRCAAFAELATSLGIKLTPSQLKALDAIEGIKKVA